MYVCIIHKYVINIDCLNGTLKKALENLLEFVNLKHLNHVAVLYLLKMFL